jgi:hypothetical protein
MQVTVDKNSIQVISYVVGEVTKKKMYFNVQFLDYSQCWYGLVIDGIDNMLAEEIQQAMTDAVSNQAERVKAQYDDNISIKTVIGDEFLDNLNSVEV